MSVEVLISPRISFSHDLIDSDLPPSSSIDNGLGLDLDFAFSVDHDGGLVRESTTADQLFSGGRLLPTDFPQIQPEQPRMNKVLKSLKEYLEDNTDDIEEEEEEEIKSGLRGFWMFGRSSSLNNCRRNRARLNIPSKLKLLSRSKSTSGADACSPAPGRSFWKFSRSNSLDCSDNRGGLIGSLKLILLRTNSTGKVLAKTRFESQGVKQQYKIRRSCSLNCDRNNGGGMIPLDRSRSTGSTLLNTKQQQQQQIRKKELHKQNSPRTCSANAKPGQRRRSFRDTYMNFYRDERVNPALNLPSPYISRATVDLLGFSSLFCNAKNRKRK